jgi:hypothetical protein
MGGAFLVCRCVWIRVPRGAVTGPSHYSTVQLLAKACNVTYLLIHLILIVLVSVKRIRLRVERFTSSKG